MHNQIQKTMQTPSVKKTAERLRINADQLQGIWFDAGMDYLELLRGRISHARVFNTQFSPMLRNSAFRRMTPEQVFSEIKNSQAFWAWWATQLWCICRAEKPANRTQFGYLLRFNDNLIPYFTLKKIFYGEQKQRTGQAIAPVPGGTAAKTRKTRERAVKAT